MAAEIWSQEYWALKGDIKLYMWRKRVGDPTQDSAPKPVLFLVHGSSFSGPTGFDLQVPGKPDSMSGHSTMKAMADLMLLTAILRFRKACMT